MWPDRVSNPGPLTYESGALPTALCGQPVRLTDCSNMTIAVYYTCKTTKQQQIYFTPILPPFTCPTFHCQLNHPMHYQKTCHKTHSQIPEPESIMALMKYSILSTLDISNTDISKYPLISKIIIYLKRFPFTLHWSNRAIFSAYCTESSAYCMELRSHVH